jgi:hypothetical protein
MEDKDWQGQASAAQGIRAAPSGRCFRSDLFQGRQRTPRYAARRSAGSHKAARRQTRIAPASSGEAFTAPGQISWLHQGGETWITLNTDADLAADATIRISGSHMPDASWFIFDGNDARRSTKRPAASEICVTTARLLACLTPIGRIRIWQWPGFDLMVGR